MALLQDLIRQIEDPVLRDRITAETDKLLKQKKFGLVFEEHLPECTPLYEVPVRGIYDAFYSFDRFIRNILPYSCLDKVGGKKYQTD